MENIAFNFALDLQEKIQSNSNNDFVECLKDIMKNYINNIDTKKSTNDMIAFTDNSGCRFEGHNIVLIDSLK